MGEGRLQLPRRHAHTERSGCSFWSASTPIPTPQRQMWGLPVIWLQTPEEADLGPVTTPDLWLTLGTAVAPESGSEQC